jgi:hypothetical protein
MKTKWCDLCENIEATHAEETLCHKCYHRVLYWTKKTPTQMMRRVKNLEWMPCSGMSKASHAKRRSRNGEGGLADHHCYGIFPGAIGDWLPPTPRHPTLEST